eukprot:CAMPEP_0185846874 /NCGR_PEP_ID=MMETSP1354-20130828/2353_1 /TAXON_ID=708628 /ORGANISM="Erythrolobus madagascarensis, Strain CCMP3276" /LENGTH=409 /DNA_ID=CAMNT_0028547085 /DNA_START=298 /DNA_END=1527 /DNA_ORIENTATION=-
MSAQNEPLIRRLSDAVVEDYDALELAERKSLKGNFVRDQPHSLSSVSASKHSIVDEATPKDDGDLDEDDFVPESAAILVSARSPDEALSDFASLMPQSPRVFSPRTNWNATTGVSENSAHAEKRRECLFDSVDTTDECVPVNERAPLTSLTFVASNPGHSAPVGTTVGRLGSEADVTDEKSSSCISSGGSKALKLESEHSAATSRSRTKRSVPAPLELDQVEGEQLKSKSPRGVVSAMLSSSRTVSPRALTDRLSRNVTVAAKSPRTGGGSASRSFGDSCTNSNEASSVKLELEDSKLSSKGSLLSPLNDADVIGKEQMSESCKSMNSGTMRTQLSPRRGAFARVSGRLSNAKQDLSNAGVTQASVQQSTAEALDDYDSYVINRARGTTASKAKTAKIWAKVTTVLSPR